jgi:hypothetical protein
MFRSRFAAGAGAAGAGAAGAGAAGAGAAGAAGVGAGAAAAAAAAGREPVSAALESLCRTVFPEGPHGRRSQ